MFHFYDTLPQHEVRCFSAPAVMSPFAEEGLPPWDFRLKHVLPLGLFWGPKLVDLWMKLMKPWRIMVIMRNSGNVRESFILTRNYGELYGLCYIMFVVCLFFWRQARLVKFHLHLLGSVMKQHLKSLKGIPLIWDKQGAS